jgi:hypothetical protein
LCSEGRMLMCVCAHFCYFWSWKVYSL